MTIHRSIGRLALGLLTVAAALAVAAPATAAAPGATVLQQQIDAHIQAYGGTQTAVNEIRWADGAVMTWPVPGAKRALSPGEQAQALGVANCSIGWTCLYEHHNFDGRRWTWSDCDDLWLANWGFQDKASSWHNNQTGGARTKVYNHNGSSKTLLWDAPSPARSTYVGDAANDKADSIIVC